MFFFLLLRFIFKNILQLGKYFTELPVFGLPKPRCILLGAIVTLAVCFYLAVLFGRLIRKNGPDFEKPVSVLVAFFFVCPSTLPFLFKADELNGTQMLYPFALFIFAISLIGKPAIKWLIPFICALYFIPSSLTKEVFFNVIHNEAILYVPLILLFLYLDMMNYTNPETRNEKQKKIPDGSVSNHASNMNPAILIISFLISITSYLYVLKKGINSGEYIFSHVQKIDILFVSCLLVTAPFLFAFCLTIKYAILNKFSKSVLVTCLFSFILLFPLFWNNYYWLGVPFLTISIATIVFSNAWQKNPAILSAAGKTYNYFLNHKLLFCFLIITSASMSNVSSFYGSALISKVFDHLPF